LFNLLAFEFLSLVGVVNVKNICGWAETIGVEIIVIATMMRELVFIAVLVVQSECGYECGANVVALGQKMD
jgi:hypothetical protein